MSWIYEVCLDFYVGEEDYHRILYAQFTKKSQAFAYAEQLMSNVYPNITAEVNIKVHPKT